MPSRIHLEPSNRVQLINGPDSFNLDPQPYWASVGTRTMYGALLL
jgi:hypothetical protein